MNQEQKKSNAVRNTIVGSIVAVVVAFASSPGFFAWLGDAEGKAQKAQERAEQSIKKAEESIQRVDMTYQLLRQQVEFMAKQIDQTNQDIRDLRTVLSMVRIPHTDVRGGGNGGGRIPASVPIIVEPPPPAPPQQIQPLPKSLDDAIRSGRME